MSSSFQYLTVPEVSLKNEPLQLKEGETITVEVSSTKKIHSNQLVELVTLREDGTKLGIIIIIIVHTQIYVLMREEFVSSAQDSECYR